MPLPGGETARMVPALFTVKLVAGTAPKKTAVAPRRVPLMVTRVPPSVLPLFGLMLVMAGIGR